MKKPQLYIETSVWNFYFADDAPEKREITKTFFDKISHGESVKFKKNGDDKRNQHEAGVFQKAGIDYSYGGV